MVQSNIGNSSVQPYINEEGDMYPGGITPRPPVEKETYYYKVKVTDGSGNGISGATVTYDTYGNKTTDSSGYAVMPSTSSSSPASITCTVSMTGYYSNTVTVSKRISSVRYDSVSLLPIPSTYYYGIVVKDSSDNTFISGAKVYCYSDSDMINQIGTYKTTDSNGKVVFDSEDDGPLYFKVTKNGYSSSGATTIYSKTTYSQANTSPSTISLTKIPTANYYYVMSVIDGNNRPVQQAIVEMANNMAFTLPYIHSVNVTDQALGGLSVFLKVKKIINGVTGVAVEDINITDRLNEDVGVDTLAESLDIFEDVEGYFDITIPIGDRSEILTVEDLVNYIINNSSPSTVVDSPYYATDENGIISVDLGEMTAGFASKIKVYVRGYKLPEGYVWNENNTVPTGRISTSTEQFVPTFTFAVQYSVQTTYYHTFKVVDTISNKPVVGATITYKHDGDVVSTQTTYSSGLSGISSNYENISISISKDEYKPFENIEFVGYTDSSECYTIRLEPWNTIRVVYDDTDSDSEFEEYTPASGITVRIGFLSSNNKEVKVGEYVTYENGYIDTLSYSLYTSTSTTYYAKVLNYNVDDPRVLKKNLVLGMTQIILPPESQKETDEEKYKFEEFNQLTINALKENINEGNNDKVEYIGGDDFRINIVDPDSIDVYDIFTSVPIMMDDDNKTIIGSVNVNLKSDINELRLKIINRYSGYYNPIFKDILFYNNYDENCLYSNTAFDNGYKDNYGKFGVINNLWFHKANENKDTEIITSLTPYYPLTGQYALDCRDYNIFESNWDMNHYTRQLDIENSEQCQNIGSMSEGLCMFGSKYLNVPETITIAGFQLGNDENWKGEWNDAWITNPDGCPGEVMFKEVNNNSVDFYFFFKKRILRYFYEKLKTVFEKYMGNEYTFGKEGVEDDVYEYVSKNVLKLYKLEKVKVFVRRKKRGLHNSKIENDYTKYLERDGRQLCDNEYFRKQGFVEISNITLSKVNRDDFDRKLVYNLRNGCEEEFGFTFIIKKI